MASVKQLFAYVPTAVLLCCAFVVQAAGRQIAFRQFTSRDGLPSDEIHDIVQDRDGRLWLATDHGVCVYDGYAFNSLTTRDGLVGNTIFRIIPDARGRLWFTSFDGGIAYHEKGEIHPAPCNREILRAMEGDFVTQLVVDNNDVLWLAGSRPGRYFRVDLKNSAFSEHSVTAAPEPGAALLLPIQPGKYLGIPNGEVLPYPSEHTPLPYVHAGTWFIRHWNGASYGCGDHLFCRNGDILWINQEQMVRLGGDGGHRLIRFDSRVTDCLEIADDTLWAATFDGLVEIVGDSVHASSARYFEDKMLTSLFRDHESNIWVGTLRNGLLMLAANRVLVIDSLAPSSQIVAMAGSSDSLVLVDENKRISLYTVDEGGPHIRRSYILDTLYEYKNNIPSFAELIGDSLYAGYRNLSMRSGESRLNAMPLKFGSNLNVRRTPDGGILHCGQGFYKSRDGVIVFNSGEHNFYGRTLCAEQDSSGTIWVGTLRGLCMLRNDSLHFLGHEEPLLGVRINDMLLTPDGALWLATKGDGVIVKRGDKLRQVKQTDGLASDLCSHICRDPHSGSLWVASNAGLSRLKLRESDSIDVQGFSSVDGLPRGQINDIRIIGDYMFVAGRSRVCYFRPNELRTNAVAPINSITAVRQAEHLLPFRNSLEFEHDHQFVEIHFNACTFRRTRDPLFRYRLTGYDRQDVYTRNRSVRYADLPAGDYTFELNAANEQGVWGAQALRMHITINRHFTEEIWFRTLVFVLALGLLVYLIFLLVKRRERIEVAKRHMIDVEYRSLRLQMNPHFIFNALNSVQHLVATRNTRAANSYLVHFSRLIRTILEHSKRRTVQLSDELKAVQDYLSLEQLRFTDKLQYTIEVQEDLDTEHLYIAPMLLQPLLENAILHGIFPKEGVGTVKLAIRAIPGGYECSIADDGVGRARADQLRAERRLEQPSMALNNIRERITLINEFDNARYSLSIEDLYTAVGSPAGTRVTVQIEY